MSVTPPPRYTQCSMKLTNLKQLPVSPPEYTAVILPSVENPPGFVTPQVQTEISTNYLGNDCNLLAEAEQWWYVMSKRPLDYTKYGRRRYTLHKLLHSRAKVRENVNRIF